MIDQDVYEVLQVHPTAHERVIQAAYRVLASMYHPDRDPSTAATRKMAELNAAYAEVRTHDLRRAYDRARMIARHRCGPRRHHGRVRPSGPEICTGCRPRRLRPLQRLDDQPADSPRSGLPALVEPPLIRHSLPPTDRCRASPVGGRRVRTSAGPISPSRSPTERLSLESGDQARGVVARRNAQNVEATTGIEPVYAVLQTAP